MTSWEPIIVKISFAALIAASVGFLAYAGMQVAWNGDRLTRIRQEAAGAASSASSVPALDLTKAQADVDALSAQAFMTADDQADFLNFLKTAPGDGIVADVHLSPRETTDAGMIRVPMQLQLSTDFPRIVRYLSRLERSKHYFFVAGVKTAPPARKDSATTTVDATIDGYAYWR